MNEREVIESKGETFQVLSTNYQDNSKFNNARER